MKEEDAKAMIDYILAKLKPQLKCAEYLPCPLCQKKALVLQGTDSMNTTGEIYCAEEGKVLRVTVEMVHEIY